MRKELVLLETQDGCTQWMTIDATLPALTIRTQLISRLTNPQVSSDWPLTWKERVYEYWDTVPLKRGRKIRIFREANDQG